MELPGVQFIPARVRPRLRHRGGRAFAGSRAPSSTPVSDRAIADPAIFRAPDPFPVLPPSHTATSAGNKVRRGIVGILHEWWWFRTRMSGDIFVSSPPEHRRIVARRMARVRRYDRLVPSRQVTYRAGSYGEEG